MLGILDSFMVLGWGNCAECQTDNCGECKDGGIRLKMAFNSLAGKTFTDTAWKGQVTSLLECSIPRLIEGWVERPEEVNARLSEYLGRPFHVVDQTIPSCLAGPLVEGRCDCTPMYAH